jgi:hypothetical protein
MALILDYLDEDGDGELVYKVVFGIVLLPCFSSAFIPILSS